MNTSFYNGVGGMKTAQIGIDVWSDNISNVNTIGYKEQNLDFTTLFSNTILNSLSSPVTSDVGVSASLATTTMNLLQGSIQKTDNVFDISLEGKGWMKVKDSGGYDFYTRTGSFVRDANGTLLSQTGDKLQVVNAKNLTFENNTWKFNSKIDTSNLVVDNVATEEIALPDDIIFPSQTTQKISIAGNLPNTEIAPTPRVANENSDFGVLYDKNSKNMNMKNGQDVVFGFGDEVRFDGLAKYEFCVNDDEADGNNVNIDFDVNGENIKLTLPDGSSSKTIVEAIANELDNKNILYDKTDNSITLKNENQIYVKSNGGDIVTKNGALQKLVYDNNSNKDEKFTNIKDFNEKLKSLATFTYGNNVDVGIDESGKLFIQNNDTNDIVAKSFSTGASNELFIQNLNSLGNIIKPNTSSKSLTFNRNYQGFTGDIISPNGDKNELKFDFYKTKLTAENTIWNVSISEIDKNGKVISTQNQDLTFNKYGALLSPNSIIFDNNGTSTSIDLGKGFNGITDIDKSNSGFIYSQDGLIEGYLTHYDINDQGQIMANFSNTKSGVVAQIPIYHFQNEQGLDSVGQNKYTKTGNSGKEFIYKNSESKYLVGAKVENYALESSNVNLSKAMTEVIITQKAFDANSKSITTSDQMIKKAIDMKR